MLTLHKLYDCKMFTLLLFISLAAAAAQRTGEHLSRTLTSPSRPPVIELASCLTDKQY